MPSIAGLRAFALVWLIALGTAQAASPRTDEGPYLRIETGVHEAVINRMALLPDGSGVVTASDDKTARIWSLDTLSPLGVLRPPIGPGDDGAVYAVAASARLIALAGRVHDADGSFAVNVIQRDGMRPLGNIGGFPAAILAMKFSPGFDALAVGMADGAGVRVIDLKTLTASLVDASYRGSVTWLDYDAHGDLVAADGDGIIVRYGADHRRIAVPLPKGAKPWAVAFSPDGNTIAVGDRLKPVVHLLDATRLRVERTLEGTRGLPGSFNVVAFAADGQALFAAGSYRDPTGPRLLRRWNLANRSGSDTPVALDTVTDLLPLPDGLLFATGEPSLGRLDTAGRMVHLRQSHHIDFRNAGIIGFRLSADGTVIELPGRQGGVGNTTVDAPGKHILFDVQAHQMLPPDALPAQWDKPSATAGGLAVTEWQNSHTPRINGQLLKLEPAETVHGVAVLPTGAAAVIGTDFFLRYQSGTGQVWQVATPATVWAVNVSADGRVVVAGLGDGTVHWYDAGNGDELQALFVDPDSGRWVLWTPAGFFDHDHRSDGMPDGRSLIGYQFNEPSRHASDFVEIGQLYTKFFRPDLVGLAFRNDPAGREEIAQQYASLGSVGSVLAGGLPPHVAMLDACGLADAAAGSCPTDRPLDSAKPADQPGVDLATTADALLVRYRLEDQGGKVGGSIIQRDDAVLAVAPVIAAEDEHSRTEQAVVPLGNGLNVIRITPVSVGGAVEATTGGSAEIKVLHEVPPPPVAVAAQDKAPPPKVTLYMLSVGISRFVHSELNLLNAENDASAVAKLMEGSDPPVYDAAVVKPLLDENATSANIIAALQAIAAKAGPDDLVLIYFAGHGVELDGQYYFIPADLGTADPDLFQRALRTDFTRGLGRSSTDALLRSEALGQDRILPLIQSIKASRVALILDTCYSGSLATEDAVRRQDINTTVTNTLGHAAGRFVLSSAYTEAADAAAPAGAADAGGHGLFTAFLLKALLGDADSDHAGRIDIYKLAKYTERNVKQASTGQLRVQTPSYYFAGNDFFELRALASTP